MLRPFVIFIMTACLAACSQPTESSTEKAAAPVERKSIVSPPKDTKPTLSLSERARLRKAKEEKEKRQAESKSAPEIRTDDQSFEERIRKHGMNAVVRPKRAFSKKPVILPLPAQSNDAAHPAPLEFRQIKANYQYYVVKGEFHPEGLPRLNGAVIQITGAVMPIDPPGKDGRMSRFWLANPSVVQAGCVFCNPPGLDDLIYVSVQGDPVEMDREKLYRSVLMTTIKGRLNVRSTRSRDGFEYLLGMTLDDIDF